MHPRTGEAGVGEGGQTRELTLKLTGEWAQVRGT